MAERTVTVKFIAQVQDAGQKMRELGEKITGIGMRITAAFTLPLAGLFAMLQKNEKFTAAFQPISDAFSKITDILVAGLIPLINQLKPDLIGLARDIGGMFKSLMPSIIGLVPTIKDLLKYVSDVVKWFTNLDTPTKDAIAKFFLFGAILGPVLVALGQFLWMGGTLIQILPGIAAGLWTTLGPIIAIGAAIYAIIKLVQMDEFKQVIALLTGSAVSFVSGSDQQGALATAQTYKKMGGGQAGGSETGDFMRDFMGVGGGVKAPASGAGGNAIYVNYAPTFSTADMEELKKNLAPIIASIQRSQPGR